MSLNKQHLEELLLKVTHFMPIAIIGGSLMLQTRGLISREPNDVDLIVPNYFAFTKFLERLPEIEVGHTGDDALSNTCEDVFGNKIQRIGCRYKSIKICVFKVPSEQFRYDCKNIFIMKDIQIRVQRPMFTIEAKRLYVKDHFLKSTVASPYILKHIHDLKEIARSMGLSDEDALLEKEQRPRFKPFPPF
jgi:hypothetical protein